ncbi:MAG: DUF21 domain-containing protein [Verrucomicrobiota bacterium]
MNSEHIIWVSIFLCLSQSAIFSGLNIGLFSLSKLSLEARAQSGSKEARKILSLRSNSNKLLATILWGNVSANCLLTMLSDSVLAGVAAFCFSTIAITIIGEILPQAYFSRYALKIGYILAPLISFYTILLYPIVKLTTLFLDRLLGQEGPVYFREKDLHFILKRHTEEEGTDIGAVEGIGAMNFLKLDDIPVSKEGEVLHSKSIISLPTKKGIVFFPEITMEFDDPFLKQVNASGMPWVVITDYKNDPKLVLDADGLMRDIISQKQRRPFFHCHKPIVVTDSAKTLEDIISKLHVHKTHAEDDVIDHDIILYWGKTEKRIITGADILGRLLRGIVQGKTISPKGN